MIENLRVKRVYVDTNDITIHNLHEYCMWLQGRNNSLLYDLENHLDIKLTSDIGLSKIRNKILDVSAEISRLPSNLLVGEVDEELQ